MWRITLRELKDRKWSLLAYCLGSLLMLWLYVATYKSSQNSTKQLQELVKTYPKGLLDALGLSNLNIDTIEKYLNAKHFSLIWPLMAIILALSRAGVQFAGEIQTGTMGLLLSLPLRRFKIFVAKYASAVVTVLIFCAVSIFGVIPLATSYGFPTRLNVIFSSWILLCLFMLTIYSFGVAVSSWVSDKSKLYAIASTVIILNYIAYIVSLINDRLSTLKHFSLFYYFNTQEALATGHIPLRTLLVFGVSIVLTTAIAVWRFSKRDIYV